MVNPAEQSVCSGCGSPLEMLLAPPPPSASPAKKSSGPHGSVPRWLSAILGLFLVYSVIVAIYEYQRSPTGSVQVNRPAAPVAAAPDHELTHRIEALEKEAAADPKNALLALQLANALHDARQFERAVGAYQTVLRLDPKNADARVDLGICYFELGNVSTAVSEITAVVNAFPKHQMAMFNLGVILLSDQKTEEAKRWLTRCVELDPQSTAGLRAQQILQQQ